MVFSSKLFLFIFLPAVLGIYFLLPKKMRNVFLFFVSLLFYGWGEPKFVFALLTSVLLNYILGLLVDKYRDDKFKIRILMVILVLFNIGLLIVFKYLNFIIRNLNLIVEGRIPQTNIALPIGISFFTFQAMSYVIDIYRKRGEVQKNPLNVGLYVALFPQLVAGPIVRYETVAYEINHRKEKLDEFAFGVKRFLEGLAKKVLIANTLAIVADKAFAIAGAGTLSISFAWLGAVAYSLQLFFDFSGYSEMAIGLGLMFGFHFEENFNYPYISKSVSEFWRRWHISLGTWFRDYVYISLGGSRVKSKLLLFRNLFAVWFLTGVWHGANWTFIAWGLMYFVLIAFEKFSGYPERFKYKVSKITYQLFTIICVICGWVLFRSNSIHQGVYFLKTMFGISGNQIFDSSALFYFKEYFIYFVFAFLLSTPIFKWLVEKISNKEKAIKIYKIAMPIVYSFIFIVVIAELVVNTHNPFIYFNF
ncbi:MBOAT family O-acyltransferase [Anaerosacchariphilus polymeriproducens]|uniref:MBOAT family protein n=1 Tax=Anaerosacchariphilus polymeriproducens TaxID=1812858 RepID=A0A371ARC3_9FIRM|nr:MBOAT family O-acyltransferase [Anaerosacchariphilus polymeriproducens]RDU22123.1 MBOAT family protein [Anaerosacchariphilus polymeriproducens]